MIVFSDYAKEQPNDTFATHIGYVESVKDGVITTIEGNAKGAVARRTYDVGATYIRGFAAPWYLG